MRQKKREIQTKEKSIVRWNVKIFFKQFIEGNEKKVVIVTQVSVILEIAGGY